MEMEISNVYVLKLCIELYLALSNCKNSFKSIFKLSLDVMLVIIMHRTVLVSQALSNSFLQFVIIFNSVLHKLHGEDCHLTNKLNLENALTYVPMKVRHEVQTLLVVCYNCFLLNISLILIA